MLHLIGIGLCDEKDVTLKGLEAIKSSDKIFLEGYTSLLQVPISKLEGLYGKQIKVLGREGVEKQADAILDASKESNAALLVIGDVFAATTHHDLLLRATEAGIKVNIIHNTSVMLAIADCGLDLYKYGRTTTLVYPEKNFAPDSFYDVIAENKKRGLHTLCLLDIKADQERYMSVAEAATMLLEIEEKKNQKVCLPETISIGCARLGCPDKRIIACTLQEMKNKDLGNAPHCLIIPGRMHVVEEEMLALYSQSTSS